MVHDTNRTIERISELQAVARELRAGTGRGIEGPVGQVGGITAAWRLALGRRVLALGLALTGEASGPVLRASR